MQYVRPNVNFLLAVVAAIVLASIASAQSTSQDFPTPATTNEINGTINARDIGDPRSTRYFYTFSGSNGDLFMNVVTKNFSGDIDVFTAAGLRPLTKIVIYADLSENETGRLIYLRKPEKLILRIQGRTPNDEAAEFRIKFGGSFIAAKESDSNAAETPVAAAAADTGIRVNSVGTIIEVKPKPTPPAIAEVKESEGSPTESERLPNEPKPVPEVVPTERKRLEETASAEAKQGAEKASVDEKRVPETKSNETKREPEVVADETIREPEKVQAEFKPVPESVPAETKKVPETAAVEPNRDSKGVPVDEKKEPESITNTVKPAEANLEPPSVSTVITAKPTPKSTRRRSPTSRTRTARVEKPAADAGSEPVAEAKVSKPVKTKREAAPNPLAKIHLVIVLKTGETIERPMSEVFKFSVDKGVLTVIGMDRAIRRYPILDVVKVTIE